MKHNALNRLQSFILRRVGIRILFVAFVLVSYISVAGQCVPGVGYAKFDFDRDCKADIATFNPPLNEWWIKYSGGTGPTWCGGAAACATTFGHIGDKIVPADYDGDGKTDIAVYTPSTGQWEVMMSSNPFPSYTKTLTGHVVGDTPQPGDYTGDKIAEIAVYHHASGTWEIYDRITNVTTIVALGVAGDIPVFADYEADGKDDVAVYTPSTGTWTIRYSVNLVITTRHLGVPGDIPVPADYEGDGKADIAVYKPSLNTTSSSGWEIIKSSDGAMITTLWGYAGDKPIPADYNGDSKADIAIYRPSTPNQPDGQWWIQALSPQPYDVWGTSIHIPAH